ncbi:MAG: flagellar filament capping protein FliD [Lachnospiraceae bacterium]|nr:flagellar filament capping protein FliD [Lachnospiraceae bacterium]
MASDLIRITGMNSGLDTESIISAYTSKANSRLTKAKGSLQRNKWTQDAWKGLNTKIYSLYANTLSNNRLSSAYTKKKTTTSNSALSVLAGDAAADGVQTAKIKSTASAGYLTSGALKDAADGKTLEAGDDLVSALGVDESSVLSFTTGKGDNAKTYKIQIGGEAADSDTTVVNNMTELADALKKAGVNANYDQGNGRLFVSSKKSGEANDFSFAADSEASVKTLSKLGLLDKKTAESAAKNLGFEDASAMNEAYGTSAVASKMAGSDAVLELNGAEFKSDTNTFAINGSTYTINSMPSDPNEEISITTGTDYDAVYDVVKDMIKEYNTVINEMTKLYNADAAKSYDPLTSEQKEEMTEDEVNEWEKKIKDGLLSGDQTLYDVRQAMIDISMQGISTGKNEEALFGTDDNGKPITMYLADFGIATAGYFDTEEDERYALHIDGNSEDEVSAGKTDKLKSLIASDPEKTIRFFQEFSSRLYDGLYKKMSGNSKLSSIYKVYNDKQLSEEQTNWEKKITDIEDEITAIEDKWYDKFSTMETLLAKMQGNQTAVSSMFGM